ncbi:MAG: hypothetical protein F6J96_27570 [Symploca sp. SIO1C2]|nr:hypothetical protein [Symploca sp. SIO1C2]
MKPDKWAITLCCKPQEKLENRVSNIVEYLVQNYQQTQWIISDIDATGSCGDKLTSHFNDEGILYLSSKELLTVLQEDGQVIDLETTLIKDEQELFSIIVQDGISIDVLGVGDILPLTVLGKYVPTDIKLFMGQDREVLPSITRV